MPWIALGIGLVVLVLMGQQQQAGSVSPVQTPVPATGQALLASPSSVRFLGLPVQSSTVARVSSSSPVNPNVIRLEGGSRFAEPQDPNVQNVLFQSGRDPGEAQQPASIIITDNSGANADIDQRLAASLPDKSARLPSVSLGPTITQQSQGLISFYAGGVDAAGNRSNQDLRAFHTEYV